MPVALVGQGAVGVAVTEYDAAARQARADHLAHQLGARGRIEQYLGPRLHGAVAQIVQQIADLLADLRAARLAREQYGPAQPRQVLGQRLDLSGFARAIRALEGDEVAGGHGKKTKD